MLRSSHPITSLVRATWLLLISSFLVSAMHAAVTYRFTGTAFAEEIFVPSVTLDYRDDASQDYLRIVFPLSAVATSGLPVRFVVMRGPAILAGRLLILTGAPGSVTIRASQAGNATYAAAADVEQTFNVVDATTNTYFGDLIEDAPTGSEAGRARGSAARAVGAKAGDIAAAIVSGSREGTLMLVAPAFGLNLPLAFTLADDGSYRIAFRVAGTDHTVSGRLSGGTLTGRIPGLRLGFSTDVQTREGVTAAIAGYYASDALGAGSGGAFSIVGTDGRALVVASTPALTTGGLTQVAPTGEFALDTGGGVRVRGAIDAPTASVSGSILVEGEPEIGFAGLRQLVQRTDRLINLSTRARFTGDGGPGTLITGFVIGGTLPKEVLLRGVGPALTGFGLADALADPRLVVFDANGQVIAENDNWGGSPELAEVMQRVGAFALPPASKDAALLLTLAPGAYTVHVRDGGHTGIALAELYDASVNPQGEYQRLINISSRGTVTAGDGVLIGGFVVTGNAPKRVLVRGAGPALQAFGLGGTLVDPQLAVYDAAGAMVARNDNWQAPLAAVQGQVGAAAAEIEAATQATGAFAFAPGAKDAALIVTLAPGAYTMHVRGANSATGLALIEVYEIHD